MGVDLALDGVDVGDRAKSRCRRQTEGADLAQEMLAQRPVAATGAP
jgi:hypothetical protein